MEDLEKKETCEYCESSKSLFYDRKSKDVREVVIELDGTLSIFSNEWDNEEFEKLVSVGIPYDEAHKMAMFSYWIEINYCPMCGRKLKK